MKQRIHKRLPVQFVSEVLEQFNTHTISESEALDLLGVKRGRLYQLRKRWLRGSDKRPFALWRRDNSALHVMDREVREWLDQELRYIRHEADTFRGRFNFAFLAEQAQKHFNRPFHRNSFRLYALRNGYYHALPSEKGKVYTRFETSALGALFQHDSSHHLWLPTSRRKHCLVATKDDHSRMIVGARIVTAESSFEHLQTVRKTVSHYGLPQAYYVDNHSIFRFIFHRGVHVRYRCKQDEGEVQFRRALGSLGIGIIYTGKRQAQAKGKIEKSFDYLQRRLPFLCEKHKVTSPKDAQPLLDEIVYFYNHQRVHEETKEIPAKRWQRALAEGRSQLRPIDPSADLDSIFSIHLKKKAAKDGTIKFLSKQWATGCPLNTPLTVCLIPFVKFMVYRNNKKIREFFI
jgi:transposase InsO family protein